DPVYQNPLVTQLVNKVLLDGKKSLAERTVYKALEVISERTANDPVITLKGGRGQLPGSGRGPSSARHHARAAVDREQRSRPEGALDGRAPGGRDHGR